VRTRIRNLITGGHREDVQSGDVVGKPDIDEREMQYSYREGAPLQFMDNKNYEQTFLTVEQMGDAAHFIRTTPPPHPVFQGKAIRRDLADAMDLR